MTKRSEMTWETRIANIVTKSPGLAQLKSLTVFPVSRISPHGGGRPMLAGRSRTWQTPGSWFASGTNGERFSIRWRREPPHHSPDALVLPG